MNLKGISVVSSNTIKNRKDNQMYYPRDEVVALMEKRILERKETLRISKELLEKLRKSPDQETYLQTLIVLERINGALEELEMIVG